MLVQRGRVVSAGGLARLLGVSEAPSQQPQAPEPRPPLKSLDECVSPPGLWGRRVVQVTSLSPLDLPMSNDEIDEVPPEVATAVLDLAMRLGELLVASGTPANDTVPFVP